MPRPSRSLPLLSLLVLCLGATTARADGLSDLKQALNRLNGQTPVKAAVECQLTKSSDDEPQTQGSVQLQLEENGRGLAVVMGKDLLQRLDQEHQAKDDGKKGKPLAAALGECSSMKLRKALSASAELLRDLDEMTLKSETTDTYKGQAARKLVFERSLDKLKEKDRKYIKQFDAKTTLWINADGVPLAHSERVSVSGRAMVVITFEQKMESDGTYTVVGDRLVLTRDEVRQSGSGAGEKGQSRTLRQLSLAS